MTTPPLVILHVGTMKSGTTYLQSRLEQHRDRLAADGVLFPGPQWKNQMRAAGDALVRSRAGENLRDGAGRWGRLRAQILGWSGQRVIVSVEHLSKASPSEACAVVAALAPCAVRVVLTVRDLGRAIPSAWQQSIKAGSDERFATFVGAVAGVDTAGRTDGDGDPSSDDQARRFWAMHDPAVLIRRWAAAVDAEHLVLVTVPPPGAAPEVLWQRFCDAVGLDGTRYPAEDSDLVLNPSLGVAGAEVIRRVNERLHRNPTRFRQSTHRDLVRFTLANSTLAGLAGDEPLRVPSRYDEWLASRARAMSDEIGASGVHVVGSLTDLVPDRTAPADTIGRPTAGTMADATVRAAAALLRRAVGDAGADPPSSKRRTILAEQVAAARIRVVEVAAADRDGGADEPGQDGPL